MPDRKISVVIVTRNRPQKLLQCLLALSKSSLPNFEAVVVDQSDKPMSSQYLQIIKKKLHCFQYIYSKQKGKSKGLNLGIQASHYPLIAFTDDDCIPEKEWLSVLLKSFNRHSEVVGIFGRTLPFQPQKHTGRICPSIFEHRNAKNTLIDTPCVHSENIGFGNNMAFRRTAFEELGGFKEWLGPGSIGSNAEDAEFSLRTLISEKKLLYVHTAVMFHNKWVTMREDEIQFLSYLCGGFACYGYYALKGNIFAVAHIQKELQKIWNSEVKTLITKAVYMEKDVFPFFGWMSLIFLTCLRGSTVALLWLNSKNQELIQ